MIRTVLAALVAASLLTPSSAFSQNSKITLSAGDFLAACTKADMAWINFCNGYIQAMVDSTHKPGKSLCITAGTTRARMVGAVVQVLRLRPQLKPHNAATVVYAVMSKLYPCA